MFNPVNADLNPIRHLLALLEAQHIFHVSGLRVKEALGGGETFFSQSEFQNVIFVPLKTDIRVNGIYLVPTSQKTENEIFLQ